MNKAITIFTKNCKYWKNQLNVKEYKKAIVYVSLALKRRARGLGAWLPAVPICTLVRAQRC